MDMGELMKQAQAMQGQMQKAKTELDNVEVVGDAGAGMVKVTMRGNHACQKVEISDSLFKRVADENFGYKKACEMIEELVAAAINGAQNKIEEAKTNSMAGMTSKLGLPQDFKL